LSNSPARPDPPVFFIKKGSRRTTSLFNFKARTYVSMNRYAGIHDYFIILGFQILEK